MRGLTLLCLLGLFLTASTLWPPGGYTPMSSGDVNFNITNSSEDTNSSKVPEIRNPDNISAEWEGSWELIGNSHGFPPLPDEEDAQGKTGN